MRMGGASVDELKDEVSIEIDRIYEEMVELSDLIHSNPEIRLEEFKAAKWLTGKLEKYGFRVTRGVGGMETAFKAAHSVEGEKPVIAFLAEYDALPGLGHACGHNVSGAASLAAAIGLSAVMDRHHIVGCVLVLGTSAEENYGGKVRLVKEGVFDGVDAAMMVHAYDANAVYPVTLAVDAVQFEFKGRAAHAAAAPHKGINALDAIIQTFNAINALRQHVRDDARIHGIITEGGIAPNIIPERGVARFYIRAEDRKYLDELTERVKNCARGAALATGCELEISHFGPRINDVKVNKVLAETFRKNLQRFVTDIREDVVLGSTDMGNVSYVVPSIHPLISITDKEMPLHTREFAEAAASRRAHDALRVAAKSLSMTAIDLLRSTKIDEVKREFIGSMP